MTTSSTPTSAGSDEVMIVAYVLQGAPASYWGELLDNNGDGSSVYIGKPMVNVVNQEGESMWTKARACGRDSVISVNPESTPGLLVLNPDADMVDQYRKEHLQTYSRITLLRP